MTPMTFLSKLGKFLATAVALAAGIGPLIAPFLGAKGTTTEPVLIDDLTQIEQLIVNAEALITGTGLGATKLAAVTPLVLQILRTSQAFDGKKIANEPLAEQGASKIVSGLADFMNAIHPDEVKSA